MISILFLIAAALIPPFVLMGVVYKMDRLEPEPKKLCWGLFIRGVLTMFPILILEMAGSFLANRFHGLIYLFLSYFVIPGFIEEGMKYRTLTKKVWNDPNFDYRFDAIVYAVFVSLGFAAVENVGYVLVSGFSTAVARAIFSIPGHAMFGVVMGYFSGKAKWMESHRQFEQAKNARKNAFLIAAILHGFYDFLLVGFGWVFYPYFIGLVIFVVRLLKRAAREDGSVF